MSCLQLQAIYNPRSQWLVSSTGMKRIVFSTVSRPGRQMLRTGIRFAHCSFGYPEVDWSVHHALQTQWERLIAKTEGTQAVAEHEESLSSYWLLVPFKMYAYWWSFAFAYFSGKTPDYPPYRTGVPRPGVALTLSCAVY